MNDIYSNLDIHCGNKIIIELSHYNFDGDNDDAPFNIAEIFIVREKTKEAEEERVNAVKIYGDDNKKIKIEILCKI